MTSGTTQGYYGSGHTPCNVIYVDIDGGTWYAVEGGVNVNFTFDQVHLGVDVETLDDVDAFTWPEGIDSEETLLEAVKE